MRVMIRPGLRREAVGSLALIAFWRGLTSPEEFEQPEGLSGIEIDELDPQILEEAVRRARGLSRHGAMRLAREIQDSLAPKLGELRKRLAAYYTLRPVARMMARAARRVFGGSPEISDPFAGAGVTLWEAVMAGLNPKLVLASEIVPEAALACYATVLTALRGDEEVLDVRAGDSFRTLAGEESEVDVILTNPPFTRWELLERDYRSFLQSEGPGASEDLRGQPSLQAFALALSERLLRDAGVLASVLPASTFYTLYGRGVVEMLRERFDHVALLEGPWHSASAGSGFKEVVLLATRGLGLRGIEHHRLTEEALGQVERLVGRRVIPAERVEVEARAFPSFLAAVRRHPIKDLLLPVLLEGLSSGALRPGPPCRSLRGVEMYGPDFFLIPNRHWSLRDWGPEGALIVGEGGRELFIPSEFLLPAFRKPEAHRWIAVTYPSHLLLTLPEDLSSTPADVREYVRWGEESGAAGPAIRSFGPAWWAHVTRQVASKRPFARLFLLDKLDPSRRGSLALYSPEQVTATKNFYLVDCGDPSWEAALAAWYNSTAFLAYLLLAGREIGPSWLRFLLDDYKSIPTPNVPSLSPGRVERAAEVLLRIGSKELPPLPDQIGSEERWELDHAVLRMIGLEEEAASSLLGGLYRVVREELALRAEASRNSV
ncbi:MAG: restriction endonuclease subunit M [Thermoproteota archaeon]|nr:MAG: restriction endonuclease subunit M [Candidatus Korarchaeota archaeon]